MQDEDFRSGRIRTVRFTLDESDFERWPADTGWPPKYVAMLEEIAKGKKVNPKTWRFRRTALSVERVFGLDTKSWIDKRWRPLEPKTVLRLPNDTLGIEIGGKLFASTQHVLDDGRMAYVVLDLTA